MGKSKKKDSWLSSEARKILNKAICNGEDARGNKVALQSGPGQWPRNIWPFFKDLPEFQKKNFSDKKLFGGRLASLRDIVRQNRYWVGRDAIALENSLKKHPICDNTLTD